MSPRKGSSSSPPKGCKSSPSLSCPATTSPSRASRPSSPAPYALTASGTSPAPSPTPGCSSRSPATANGSDVAGATSRSSHAGQEAADQMVGGCYLDTASVGVTRTIKAQLSKNGTGPSDTDPEGGDGQEQDEVPLLTLSNDLMANIMERILFKYMVRANLAFGKFSNVPFDRMRIPADIVPLLLHCGTRDETFMFYDPLHNIIFEIDRPRSTKVGKLCDFSKRKLVTTIPDGDKDGDGVSLVDMLTGARNDWKFLTMPSDCYIIWANDHVVKAVIGTKGSNYYTTIAILRKSKKIEEKGFSTEVPFTVSPLTNPVLSGDKLFCLSTEGKLGIFDLKKKAVNIYEEEQEDNHEDSDEDGTDDEDSERDGTDNEDSEEDEDILNDFTTSADFLCSSTSKEIFRIRVGEGWRSVQVNKLEEPDMIWHYMNSLGNKAIFTGTRCTIISVVPEELQNKIFLPGYYGSPRIVKANLIESEGRFFFCPTSFGGMSKTSSPWFCMTGEGSDGQRSNPVALENSLWIQLNSCGAVKERS